MNLAGIHFLTTYQCNCECAHCFLSCGPKKKGFMAFSDAKKYIDEAKKIRSINYFYIEGGEPFLDADLALRIVDYAVKSGFWTGILTNAFWGLSYKKSLEALKPFKEAGLSDIGISTDKFHQKKVSIEHVANAVRAAKSLEIEVSVMVTTNDDLEFTEVKEYFSINKIEVDIWQSNVKGKGRGASLLTERFKFWQTLDKCSENIADPKRVHIGCNNDIHICQDLLIDKKYLGKDLIETMKNYGLFLNKPIPKALIKGGPAELARYAQKHGFKPKDKYADGCQLCCEVRQFLEGK